MALLPAKRMSTPSQFGFPDLQREMNRLFSSIAPLGEQELAEMAWSPEVDVYEDDKAIRVQADIPGVEPKDVDVNIEGGRLTVHGERKLEKEDKKENYRRVERSYGSFTRSFTLPDYADTEKVDASFKNGVLDITIPKRPEEAKKSRKVEVKSH